MLFRSLSEYPLSVLGSTVSQRILFPEAAAMGQLVTEIDLKSPAAREIAGFASDVRLLMS